MAVSVEKIDESAVRIRSNQFFALPIYLYLVVAAAGGAWPFN